MKFVLSRFKENLFSRSQFETDFKLLLVMASSSDILRLA